MLKHLLRNSLIIIAISFGNVCYSETVVRFTFNQSASTANVDLKLFDESKPDLVTNFMLYVDDGSYDNSFVSRSLTNFIIQGGGYNFDPDVTDFSTSVSLITSKGFVDNDPGLANLRGTIAMARPAGAAGVDEASSEWFINLDDNNTVNLDPVDGGADAYSVFGEVLNNGMNIIDTIDAAPVFDLGGPFDTIPLVGFSSLPVITSNLIQISSVETLFKISSNRDFGMVTPRSNLQPEFFIENISDKKLLIGNFANTNPIDLPFIILGLRCDNAYLLPGEICAFAVAFNSPEDVLLQTYSDSFNIEFPELNMNYTLEVKGEGGPQINEPDISQVSSTSGFRSTEFGEVDLDLSDAPVAHIVTIAYQNRGLADLNISSIALVPSQPDEFTLGGSCLTSDVLAVGGFCTMTLEFLPVTLGKKEIVIQTNSDDPDEPVFNFTFKATVTPENDGVDVAIEDAGPNNGDGNYDGILDSIQSNVVSLPGVNGKYITLIGGRDIRYRKVKFTDRSAHSGVPNRVAEKFGVLEFSVDNINLAANLQAGIILPKSVDPSSYYVFGPETSDQDAEWFKFDPDTTMNGRVTITTGTTIITDATLDTDDGETVKGTFVTLFLTNGERGDSSFESDDEIRVVGAFKIPSSGSGSGYLNFIELFLILLIGVICRKGLHR